MRIPAIIKSVAVATAALSAALVLGAALQRDAARRSQQQPTAERLFERTAPAAPALIATGRKLYLDSCAHCHGADVRGDEGPDLHDLQVSDRYIANTIRRGIPHEMPSFAKKHGPEGISALTAYLRSLE